MATLPEESVRAIIATFVDQVCANFERAAPRSGGNGALVRIADKGAEFFVAPYLRPDDEHPNRPWILRIYVYPNLIEQQRLETIGLTDPIAARLPCRLEFNVVPEELMQLAGWTAEWLKAHASPDEVPPKIPILLSGESDFAEQNRRMSPFITEAAEVAREDFLLGTDGWREVDYLWSRASYEAAAIWHNEERAAQADDSQFVKSVYDTRYPDVIAPRNRPKFEMAELQDWSNEKVLFAGRFRPGRFRPGDADRFRPSDDWGPFIFGPAVDEKLREACARGYIVLPEAWEKSKFWSAWQETWLAFCELPGHRRPYIAIQVGPQVPGFGSRVHLSWDWITMDPVSDPSEDWIRDPRNDPSKTPEFEGSWQVLHQRIAEFMNEFTIPTLENSPNWLASENGRVGDLITGSDFLAPVLWWFEWTARFYPTDVP